ncbi:MAG: penicillin acylase family protein [Candidatus Dormibacteria bacterium]
MDATVLAYIRAVSPANRPFFARAACVAAAIALMAGLLPAPVTAAPGSGGLSATIRRTSGGIPHIVAKDFAGLGFGYGFAFASDNICTIADSYVTVDAQRSRYFGPSGSWVFEGNGFSANNLNSDFFFQQVIDDGRIERLLAQAPPNGPRPEVKDGVRGYVAGYNRYLAETGVNGISDPTCRGKPWVHPITEMDAYRRFYELALMASSGVALDGIGGAMPSCAVTQVSPAATAAALATHLDIDTGSNAVALGSAATRNGHGLLLGNPHFPWHGAERFYQSQMTIPGVVNVSGGSLFGVPIILIGHTDSMAWSHTVSTAFRFTPYQLTTVPGQAAYLVDGVPEKMTARTMTVQALQADGSLQPVSRTLYRTRWGSMLTSLTGIPLPWCGAIGFAMADANEANFRYANHFLETNLAHSVQEEYQVLKRNQGVPWVNTIVADNAGQAFYADISVTPNVPDAMTALGVCGTALGTYTISSLGLPVLDGSKSSCAWRNDPDAVAPGTFGPHNMPHLFRADYTENSNDSYWLSNPRQPLETNPAPCPCIPFARIIGDQRAARGLRTRLGVTMLEEYIYGFHGKSPSRFDRQQMQDMVFNDRQYGGELARDAAVSMCQAFPLGVAPTTLPAPPVPVDSACEALRKWDLTENIDSHGAVLWREFWSAAITIQNGPWKVPFDAGNPVDTPNTLDIANPLVQRAFGDAVATLKSYGLPLDSPLRPLQYAQRGAVRIPIHGGPADPNGTFNAIDVGRLADKGGTYGDTTAIGSGSSFVQVVSFNGTPCPDSATILTYSQSANPSSPYYADQTQMFSQKKWVTDLFCEGQILADPNLTTRTIADTPAAAALPAARSLPATGRPSGLPVLVALLTVAALLAWPGTGRRRRRG